MKNCIKLTLISSLLILSWSCKTKVKEQSGKVKSYTKTSYLAIEKDGKIVKDKKEQESDFSKDEKKSLDEKGQIIENISYNSDGSIYTQMNLKYDEKGNNTERTLKKESTIQKTVSQFKNNKLINNKEYANKILMSLQDFSYDEKGAIIKEEFSLVVNIKDTISTKLLTRNTFTYNNSGKLTETYNYTIASNSQKIEDSEYEKIVNKYDSKGNLISVISSSNDNLFIDKIVYTYDDKGNKIKYINYDKNDSILNKIKYKYNDKNKEIEYIEYDNKLTVIRKETSLYDTKGNKIGYHIFAKNNDIVEKFTYDKNNRLIEHSIKEDSNTKTVKNEYDKFGNITKKVKFENGKPTYIIETVYEFY